MTRRTAIRATCPWPRATLVIDAIRRTASALAKPLLACLLLWAAAVQAAPPVVSTVPVDPNDVIQPHDIISGQPTTLKGAVDAASVGATWTWDPGDGSASVSGTVNGRATSISQMDNAGFTPYYAIWIQHTYTGTDGDVFLATLTVTNADGESDSAIYRMRVRDKNITTEVNAAIDEALWFMHRNQFRFDGAASQGDRTTTPGPIPMGMWNFVQTSGTVVAASTAAALNAFEANGYLETGPSSSPYTETVERAMNYTLATLAVDNLSLQTRTRPAGASDDPDANGNGIGIRVNGQSRPYQGGMLMDAIIASGTPDAVAAAGRANIVGRTYGDIVQDMADWYAWAQSDNTSHGGWRYSPWNNSSGSHDNSTSGWAAIGLVAAEDIFGSTVPQWVKDRNIVGLELTDFESNTDDYTGGNDRGDGSHGYTNSTFSAWGPFSTTAAAMVQMTMDDIESTTSATPDERWIRSENFFRRHFNGPVQGNEFKNYYYAMFNFAKAMRTAVPQEVVLIGTNNSVGCGPGGGTPGCGPEVAPLDWYLDPVSGLARTIVDYQVRSGVNIGMFTDRPGNTQGRNQDEFNSPWATQILTRTLFQAGPVARATANPNPGASNSPIQFDGSGSFHQDPARSLISFDWDFNNDGVFDASGVTSSSNFDCPTLPVPCEFIVRLRVTDDNVPARFADALVTVDITIPPRPPTADAGGPYLSCVNEALTLDGSGSFDVDEGTSESGAPPFDTITNYAWELDGVSPFDFDEASGVTTSVIFPVPTLRDIGLEVTDNTSVAFPTAQQPNLAGRDFTSISIEDCSCIGPIAARTKPGKAQLVWQPVPGAVNYDVLRSAKGSAERFETVAADHVTDYATYLDRNLVNGTTYWYRVVPKGADGLPLCPFSQAVSATPQLSRRTRTEFVAVPDLVGQTQSEAAATLMNTGLAVGEVSFANDDTIPEGAVVSSDPAAGTSIVEGSAVALVISLGPPRVAVPDVTGETQAAAEAALAAAGLLVGDLTSQNSDTVPEGNIIFQDPPGGVEVVVGSAVNLVVSLGPVTVPVPDVVGSTQADGEAALVVAGLAVGGITSQNSDTVPAGGIIAQDPAAGTSVVLGTAVDLVVSLGPVTFAVPDVIGLPQADAEAAIVAASLAVGTIDTQHSAAVPAGNVINQSPGAGSQVVTGTAVNLVVSLGAVQVTVPNVVGLTQTDAETALVAADLGPGTITEQNSLAVPAGNVISQEPAGGATVDESSLVDLVVSIGPRQITVPNVVGLPQADAEAAIIAADLTVGAVTSATSPTVPAGSVISQDPGAGSVVDEQSAVDLVISEGPAQVTVPNVVGLSQAEASAAIVAADLVVGVVTNATSISVPAGDVISQAPAGGAIVDEQSAVDLVVSLGPAQVSVPDVVGIGQAAAESAITGAGLLVGTVDFVNSDTVAAGEVISQAPAGGTTVDEGSAVNLVVSLGAADVQVPNVVGFSQATAETAIAGAGLTVGAVTIEPSFTVPAGDVISQNPPGGVFVADGSAVDLVVSDGAPPDDEPPVLSAFLDRDPPLYDQGETVQLSISASDNSGFVTVTYSLDGGASLPAVLPVTTIDTSAFAPGSTHSILVVAEDAVDHVVSDTLNFAIRDPNDTTPPTVSISSPADLAAITMPTDIIGTANDPGLIEYSLEYSRISDGNVFIEIASGDASVVNGLLGGLDPTMLENGLYKLRLVAVDANGNAGVAERVLSVEGEAKIGVTRFSLIDLAVPVSGVPIVVERSYDSRRKTRGDFGIGWELEIRQGTFEHNRPVDQGWSIESSGGFIPLPCQNVEETASHRTVVRLSDREYYTFALELFNPGGSNVNACFADVRFRFIPEESSRPGATLQIQGQTSVWWLNGALADFDTFDTYRVDNVRLTTVDGRVIDFDANIGGVTRIADRHGNSLNITPGGLVSSTGVGIAFNRDALGRITSIVDPSGERLEYEYDTAGDLVLFRDREASETTYDYDGRHNITTVIDPAGVMASRSEYDENGRLIAITDANGNRVEFTHDLEGREEIITDSLGNVTVLNYDEDGNILSKETPVTIEGVTVVATTEFAYDEHGNQTVLVDPDNLRQENGYDTFSNPTSKVVDPGGLNITRAASYTPAGDVLTETDPLGNVYSFGYDGSGNPTSFTDIDGRISTAAYDDSGQLTHYEDADGNSVDVDYDSAGRVSQSSDSLGNTTRYTYDGNGNVLTTTVTRTIGGAATDLVTTYEYNAQDQVTRIVDPLGHDTRFEYNELGLRSAMTDKLGRTTTYTYDQLGDLVRTDYPDGSSETFVYDPRGLLIEAVDREGLTTRFEYDELGRRTALIRPDGGIERTVYTPGGRIAAQIATDGSRTDFEYDNAGRVVRILQPAVEDGVAGGVVRPEWRFEHDASGIVTAMIDPLGNRTETEFDRLTGTVIRRAVDGSEVVELFDALGRLTSQTDADGNSTIFTYLGSTQRLATVTQPPPEPGDAAPVWQFDYDEAGNRISQTDPLGRVTTYEHDELNRLVSTTLPGGQTRTMAYDALGNLISFTDYDGATMTMAYDAANRIISKTLSDGTQSLFSYTDGGSRATITDSRGVTSYEYDDSGRLARLVQPGVGDIRYEYDARNRISRITTASGIVDYSYDALDRIVSVGSAAGLASYKYDLLGNPVEVQYPNSVVAAAQYNGRNELQDLQFTNGGTTLASYQYAYTPGGRRASIVEPSSTTTYSYDALGRLIEELRTGADAYSREYDYDPAGNRAQMIADGTPTTYTYDVNDRLLTAGAVSFSYDAKGNLLTRTEGGNTTNFAWTPDNRLASFNDGSGPVSFLYDADGMRVEKQLPTGAITRFLIDPRNPSGYAQVLEETNQAGVLQASRIFGPGGIIAADTGSGFVFHHQDAQLSTRLLTDAAGAEAASYVYDAFGNVLSHSGTSDTTHQYGGQQFDAESGLLYMRARYYDPRVGRFLSLDPVAGDPSRPATLNRYCYAGNDPVDFGDPNGEFFSMVGISFGSMISSTLRGINVGQKASVVCRFKTLSKMITLLQGLRNGPAMSGLFRSPLGWGASSGIGDIAKWVSGSGPFPGGGQASVTIFKYMHPWAGIAEANQTAASVSSPGGSFSWRRLEGEVREIELKASFKVSGKGAEREFELSGQEFGRAKKTLKAVFGWPEWELKSLTGGVGNEIKIAPVKLCGVELGDVVGAYEAELGGNFETGAIAASIEVSIAVKPIVLPDVKFTIAKIPDDL